MKTIIAATNDISQVSLKLQRSFKLTEQWACMLGHCEIAIIIVETANADKLIAKLVAPALSNIQVLMGVHRN